MYRWCMARTNIDINDEVCARVMRRYGLTTKRDAVNFALKQLDHQMTIEEALAMQGTGWEGDLDEMRSGNRVEHL